MAERRRRHRSAVREQIAAHLRDLAERQAEGGNLAYQRLGEITVREAERIERGDKPVVVQGWKLPDGLLEPDANPSNPYVLHPDGRLTAA